MTGLKYVLIPRNDLFETFNQIFPGMIKNVFAEVIRLDLYPNHFQSDVRKCYSEVMSFGNEIELEPANTVVLELISGNFVFFQSAGTGGATLGKYTNEYEIYYS
jgi:hypothetical protein